MPVFFSCTLNALKTEVVDGHGHFGLCRGIGADEINWRNEHKSSICEHSVLDLRGYFQGLVVQGDCIL